MDDTIHAFHCFIKTSFSTQVPDHHKFEPIGRIRSSLAHLLSFRRRSRRGPHAEATTEQLIYDMRTDEPCRSGDKNKLAGKKR